MVPHRGDRMVLSYHAAGLVADAARGVHTAAHCHRMAGRPRGEGLAAPLAQFSRIPRATRLTLGGIPTPRRRSYVRVSVVPPFRRQRHRRVCGSPVYFDTCSRFSSSAARKPLCLRFHRCARRRALPGSDVIARTDRRCADSLSPRSAIIGFSPYAPLLLRGVDRATVVALHDSA